MHVWWDILWDILSELVVSVHHWPAVSCAHACSERSRSEVWPAHGDSYWPLCWVEDRERRSRKKGRVPLRMKITHWGQSKMTDILKSIFLNENIYILSLKGIPGTNSSFVLVLTWRSKAAGHYLNQFWTSSLTYICATRLPRIKVLLYATNTIFTISLSHQHFFTSANCSKISAN